MIVPRALLMNSALLRNYVTVFHLVWNVRTLGNYPPRDDDQGRLRGLLVLPSYSCRGLCILLSDPRCKLLDFCLELSDSMLVCRRFVGD